MSNIILYETPQGKISVSVRFEDETFWLTQKAMAELFGVESHTITYHLKEIYKTGELDEMATARKIRVVQKEGNREVNRERKKAEALQADLDDQKAIEELLKKAKKK